MIFLFFDLVLEYKACNIDRRATRATRDSALWACGAAGDSELLGKLRILCKLVQISPFEYFFCKSYSDFAEHKDQRRQKKYVIGTKI